MKLEKMIEVAQETGNNPRIDRRRWYDDACGTALAMELVGERWSLLIVRELMFGGRRFSELRGGLPGISANVLTQRLDGMERVGILQKRKLPPPASAQVYELTPWGYEAETILQELGRWAVRSPLHDPRLPLSPASIMMSFRTMYSPQRSGDETATIGFRMGADHFVAHAGAEAIDIRRSVPEDCALIVDTNPISLASVVYGGRPLRDAQGTGEIVVQGDRALFERFVTWFPLPAKYDSDG
jgi:DNA-binding HxlR family transcriptional regulator